MSDFSSGAVQVAQPYASIPADKLAVRGTNLRGYGSPLDSQMSGTVVPHVGPGGSFGSTPRIDLPLSVGVVTIEEPDPNNPFSGGIRQLVPPMAHVTIEEREAAMKEAQQMTTDPIRQGMLMFEIMAKRREEAASGASAASAAPVSPPVQAAPAFNYPPPPVVPAPAPAPAASEMQALLHRMAEMMGQMSQAQAPAPVMAPVAAPMMPVVPPPPAAAAPPVPTQPAGVNLGQLLGIPGLDYQPQKPSAKVVFNLGPLGNSTAYYHWVLRGEKALFLVMDNRYEGTSYEPPAPGVQQPIAVILPNTETGSKKFVCYSSGLQLMLGIFTVTILLLAKEQPDG